MWTPHEIRISLENLKNEFQFRMPQMQTLLCQERFLLRLNQLKEGKNYIWKGGSLLVRRYQPIQQIPRFTVDLDLEAWKISVSKTKEIFKQAIGIDLKDGFKFFRIRKEHNEKRNSLWRGKIFHRLVFI